MVKCLCALHNLCIDSQHEPDRYCPPSAQDALNLEIHGAVTLNEIEIDGQQELVPEQLLNGWSHFDDDPGQSIRHVDASMWMLTDNKNLHKKSFLRRF